MAAIRKATATWEGSLIDGRGQVTAATTGVFKDQPITWKARTEGAEGNTGPEELLAAAHASCFAMALSHELAGGGTPAQKLEVSVAVTFGPVATGGFAVESSEIEVRGQVAGLDASGFEKAAQGAKDGCPISRALGGNVKLSVKASLE